MPISSSKNARRRWPSLVLGGLSIVLSGLVLPCPAAAAGEIRAEVRLEPEDVVGLDETAVLEIKIASNGRQRFHPEPHFELENFRAVGGPFHSSSLRIINGVQSSTVTLTWQLQPLALGTAKVHTIRLTARDESFELGDREVLVVEEAPPGRRGANRVRRQDPFASFFDEDPFESFLSRRRPRRDRSRQSADIFLVAEAEPRNPWVGQQVLYTLYLYTEADVHSINPIELPEFKGFWAQKIPQPERPETQMVEHDGRTFGRAVLKQWALFPRRAGTFDIEPVTARMAARFLDPSPFASLIPRTREVTRKSNGLSLEVRELPAPPPGFQGLVGQLKIDVTLDPPQLEVGEAATLSVEVGGRGHLQGVPAPTLQELTGVEIFPPQQQSSEELRGRSVHGKRTWRFVLVPQRPGEWQLPPLEIPYFDPSRGEYRSAVSEPLTLVARGPKRLAQGSGPALELHPIRTSILPASQIETRLPSAWWLFVLPWVLFGALMLVRRGEPGGGRRALRRRLLDDLAAARKEERTREAAARIESAWRRYLEERWKIAQGTPSTQWGEMLIARGVKPEAARQLVALADDVHYLRYAPKLSSVDELRHELVERSRKLARSLG